MASRNGNTTLNSALNITVVLSAASTSLTLLAGWLSITTTRPEWFVVCVVSSVTSIGLGVTISLLRKLYMSTW
jgi:hypothetical protein